jgi:RNA polymerase sigma-70 factor (ECF subfamily)
MAVLYLVFNEGYSATSGDALVRRELAAEAIRLARLLCQLMPGEPPPEGLLALMLLHDSRRDARTTPEGDLVLLEEQDRTLWDRTEIAEGVAWLASALKRTSPDVYTLQAAIAAEHARAPRADDTDWAKIAALYADLSAIHPSPVVLLNRAVAISMRDGPAIGLEFVDELAKSGVLAGYHLLPAARADLLRRLGACADAAAAYLEALALVGNDAERRFLEKRLRELEETN